MEATKMSMDIKKASPGYKVVFMNPEAGWSDDQFRAKKANLVVGREYTLAKVEVHSWHTKIWLEEVEGIFNSVQFEDV
jgi:hypothetical protein